MNNDVSVFSGNLKVQISDFALGTFFITSNGKIGVKLEDGHLDLRTGFVCIDNQEQGEPLQNGQQITITIKSSLPFTDAQHQYIRNLCSQNDKIQAIKYVRGLTGWGLKEAKDLVDNLVR